MSILFCFIIFTLFYSNVFAQNTVEKRWSLSPSYGFIYAHSKDVENTKGARPFGVQADYAWRKTDSITYKKFFGFPVQGVSVIYFDYDNKVLGNGTLVAYFMEPEIRWGKRMGAHMHMAAGFAWLSNPHDIVNNPNNNSYSTHISGYLSLGIQPYVQLSEKWQLMLAATYRHLSNGGIKLPNKGVNWITGEAMLCYFPNGKRQVLPQLQYYRQQHRDKINRTDIWVFGAPRGSDDESKKKYGLLGVGAQYALQTGSTHSFTAGLEFYNDNADRQQMKDSGIDASALKAGAMIGHEFLWGRFIFSQQLGIYLFDKTPYYTAWFHRWGLYYCINEKWMTGINLKAHKHVANFTDLRIIYTLRNKGK
jgi:hypothetical protein